MKIIFAGQVDDLLDVPVLIDVLTFAYRGRPGAGRALPGARGCTFHGDDLRRQAGAISAGCPV